MADWRDVQGASTDADAAQAALETFLEGLAEAGGAEWTAGAIAHAGLAICARLETLEVRLDYLVHEALKQTSFG